ncbi:MAG: 4Fe-4S binding protein [Chloroflexi bacterium]|nr:4Fe-4S binding protein [Chloroflexota bacterium]
MHRSTRDFIREARQTRHYSLFDFLHGYFYGRWTYFYIAVGAGSHPLTRRLAPLIDWFGKLLTSKNRSGEVAKTVLFEDTYHGKVVPLAEARQLVSVNVDIPLGDLEKIIPYALARDLILKNPDHIAVIDCPCRAAREHPCLPLDVCLIVGEPFASFVIDHHPKKARWITSDEAQQILSDEDRRGHVHHAFFKDAMLGRFYAICNCCSCCCGAMQAQQHGTLMLASSGYVAQIDPGLCIGCGSCEQVCQFGAIHVNGSSEIDTDVCMGCGVCANQCDQAAITLVRMESKGQPLEIQRLVEEFESSHQV